MELDITTFQNGLSPIEKLKPGSKVVVAPAGTNLKVTGEGVAGSIVKVSPNGNVRTLTVQLDRPAEAFEVTGVARIRLVEQ